MNPSDLLAAERAGICDDFDQVGADAPTLCEGWRAIDLAAHLVVREHEVVASAGIVLPGPFATHLQRRMEAAKADGFERLVERIRQGPAFHMKVLGPRANLGEYFVHREDLRRANGHGPRELGDALEAFLWSGLALTQWLAKANVRGFGLVLVAPGYGTRTVRDAAPLATICGPPSELTLYMAGRKRAAQVTVDGTDAARNALADARFGF